MKRESGNTWHSLLSAASGLAWGVVGFALCLEAFPAAAQGGLYASPFIGVIVGRAFVRARNLPGWGKALVSLLSLYLAASLFAIAIGVYDVLRDIPDRIASAVVVQAILAVLWGLSFGWFLVLWPLALMNHSFLWRLVRDPKRTEPV